MKNTLITDDEFNSAQAAYHAAEKSFWDQAQAGASLTELEAADLLATSAERAMNSAALTREIVGFASDVNASLAA